MKGKSIIYMALGVVLMALLVAATEFSPQGDINLKSRYNITNGLNANITNINSQYITAVNVTAGNHNGRFNWTTVSSFFSFNGAALDFVSNLFNISYDGRYIMQVNESKLNVNNSQFLGGNPYTNHTATSIAYADLTFITKANESNLNVNHSVYSDNAEMARIWGGKQNATNIYGSEIHNDLNWKNFTNLSQFTNDLSGREFWTNHTSVSELYCDANFYNKSANIEGALFNVTASYFFGDGSGLTGVTSTATNISWTEINNATFPVSCPGGEFITQVGTANTCAAVSGFLPTSGGEMAGQINMTNQDITGLGGGRIFFNESGVFIIA